MKTTTKVLSLFVMLLSLTVSSIAQGERTVGWSLLGGDTFATNRTVMAGYNNYEAQLRSVGEQLIGSLPEQRDNESVLSAADLAAYRAAEMDRWMGSSNLVIGNDSEGDGLVKLADTSKGGIGYLPLIDSPLLGGSFKVEADVRVSKDGHGVVGIGMLQNLGELHNGTDALFGTGGRGEQGLAQMWVRVAEINSQSVPDSLGNTFLGQDVAQICLMSGSGMVERLFVPLDANGMQDMALSNAAGVPDLSYGRFWTADVADGFDRVWLEWFPNTNAVEVKFNGHTIDALSINLDLVDLDNNNIAEGIDPDLFAMSFQLQGDGELSRFAATPEPSSMIMMCFSMLFFGFHNRRNRRRARKLGAASLSLVA